jgi:hypothetical protein
VLSSQVEYRLLLGILSVFTPTTETEFAANANPLNQLDSLKSRLQTIKHPISVPSLAILVYREEGVRGFYRGLWIPLVTITFVRMSVLFHFRLSSSPQRPGTNDVTRGGIVYHLFRDEGDPSECSHSQSGYSRRYLTVGGIRVRP